MLQTGELDVLHGVAGLVLAVTDANIVAYASPDALQLLGWHASLVGRPLTSIIPIRLQGQHLEGFKRYVHTGVSHLQGTTVRVPARCRTGVEVDVDLTIRVFRRPDQSKLAVAVLSKAALGKAPASVHVLENAFIRRVYQLV